MVYGTQKTIVTGAYKPTYNWGASHFMIYARFDVATPVQAVVEANVPRMGDLHDLHAKL